MSGLCDKDYEIMKKKTEEYEKKKNDPNSGWKPITGEDLKKLAEDERKKFLANVKSKDIFF
jgi:hypothetical protein